jgi:hypothetical protein
MQIFEQEKQDGLEETIKSSASISYACLAEPCADKALAGSMKHIKSLASLDDNDLYYVQSILVTSSWNKNDDIFDKSEIWMARKTPEDKPTNLEHDESIIIGHIVSNYPVTEDGIIIDENTELNNLPEKYHILTGSVIYKAFSSPELRERSEKLIAEIENGSKYVSMECLFKGFDYGLLDKQTNEYKILARNNETAYLTKYLRSYGGAGEHQNYKIGRVLRNITFSGKGFVNKPANPDSIIFTKNGLENQIKNISSEKNEDLLNTGVIDIQFTNSTENTIMSLDLEPVMKNMEEIKNKIEAMEVKTTETASTQIESLQKTLSESNELMATHETKIAEITAALEAAQTEKEEAAKKMTEEMAKKEEEMKKMKAELDVALETIAGYKSKEEEMLKKEKKMKRMAALLETGLDSEEAQATVDKFESLDDETFDAITSLAMVMKMKKKKEEEAKMTKSEEVSEEVSQPVVTEAALENVEVESQVNLGIGGETESPVENTRAALVEFVSSRLGKKL